jgi:hypothetical protein
MKKLFLFTIGLLVICVLSTLFAWAFLSLDTYLMGQIGESALLHYALEFTFISVLVGIFVSLGNRSK